MDHKDEEKSRHWQKRQLVLALVIAAVVAVVMGTLAWLNYERSLMTMTTMQMPILFLQDENGTTTSIELSNLDLSKEDTIPVYFGVYATATTKYLIQLAHTTNLPLHYEIYPTTRNEALHIGSTRAASGETPVAGYDLTPENGYARDFIYEITYGSYDPQKVQSQAMPEYWQSEKATKIKSQDIHYYRLEVSWDGSDDTKSYSGSKETEMIYVTVGTTLKPAEGEETEPAATGAEAAGGNG